MEKLLKIIAATNNAAELAKIAEKNDISSLGVLKPSEKITIDGDPHVFVDRDQKGHYQLKRLKDQRWISKSTKKFTQLWKTGRAFLGDYKSHLTLRQAAFYDIPLSHFPEHAQQRVNAKLAYLTKFKKDLETGAVPNSGRKAFENWLSSFEKLDDNKEHPSAGRLQANFYLWRNAGYRDSVLIHGNCLINRTSSLHPKVVEICRDVIEQVWLSNQSLTALELQEFMQVEIDQLIEKKKLPKGMKAPAEKTINNYKKKHDPKDVIEIKYGGDEAQLVFGAVGKQPKVMDPFAVLQIDHSLLKIRVGMKVIDQLGNEHMILVGQCWVTAVIDVHSKFVLSAVVGLEPPSSLRVIQAIREAIEPADRHDKLATKPPGVEGLPTLIVMDNGLDFHSFIVEQMLAEIGIQIQYTAAYRGDQKPEVERLFRTAKFDLYRWFDVTKNADRKSKKSRKTEKQTELVEVEFLQHVVADYLRIHNLKKRKSLLGYSSMDLMAMGLARLKDPAISKKGSKFRSLLELDRTDYLRSMKMRFTRKFQYKTGVRFFYGDFYSDAGAELVRNSPSQIVEIRVDPADLKFVEILDVRDPSDPKWVKLYSTQPEYFSGLSLATHRKTMFHVKNYIKENDPAKSAKDIDLSKFTRNKMELLKKVFARLGKKLWHPKRKLIQPSVSIGSSVDVAIACKNIDLMSVLAGKTLVDTPMRRADFKQGKDGFYYEPDPKQTKKEIMARYAACEDALNDNQEEEEEIKGKTDEASTPEPAADPLSLMEQEANAA